MLPDEKQYCQGTQSPGSLLPTPPYLWSY
jgi:hypothetical protein